MAETDPNTTSSADMETGESSFDEAKNDSEGMTSLSDGIETIDTELGIATEQAENGVSAELILEPNILPNRNISDIARDKKRILEIFYGNDGDVLNTARAESKEGTKEGEEKKGQIIVNGKVINPRPPKKKKATPKKKKSGAKSTSKATDKQATKAADKPTPKLTEKSTEKTTAKPAEKPSSKSTTDKSSTKATTKQGDKSTTKGTSKTTSGKSTSKATKDGIKSTKRKSEKKKPTDGNPADSADGEKAAVVTSDAADNVDTGEGNSSTEESKTSTEEKLDDGKDTVKKKKKKKKKKSKKKKDTKPIERDAAGRVKRKRRKVKHRYKVVKKHLIKNGKDAKIALDPIMEDDEDASRASFDGSSHRSIRSGSSRRKLVPLDSNGRYLPNPLDMGAESSPTEYLYDSDEDGWSDDSSSSSGYWSDTEKYICFTRKGLIVLALILLATMGVSIGVTYYLKKENGGGASVPSMAPTSKPSVLPSLAPSITVPTISSAPSSSPTTAAPTVPPEPTLSPTTSPPTFDRVDYLTLLVEAISPDFIQSGSPQERAFNWMTSQDLMPWASLEDREIIERYIMVVLYYATGGSQWRSNSEWLSELHVCQWYGIDCYLDVYVGDLNLGNSGLSGVLPTEIGQLAAINELDLSQNYFTGSIPSEIGLLDDLEEFNLCELKNTWNLVNGAIPDELFNLSSLQSLDLDTNYLNDTLSAEVTKLSSLTVLSIGPSLLALAQNNLNGTIPTQLGEMTNLQSLRLQQNSLDGTIPTELGLLVNMEYLFFASNELTGLVPSELGNLSNLEWLDLSEYSQRHFAWMWPSSEIASHVMNFVDRTAGDNELTGTVPPEVQNLADWAEVDYCKSYSSILGFLVIAMFSHSFSLTALAKSETIWTNRTGIALPT
eukprot:scaffold1537_cov108-Cylindrotheca_fusiformis.AAC.5